MIDYHRIDTQKSLIQKKLETLKGAGLGNSVAEEKHEDMKQEKVEEIEDGFDDDDDFDDLVAQLDNDPTATLKSSVETQKISNKVRLRFLYFFKNRNSA